MSRRRRIGMLALVLTLATVFRVVGANPAVAQTQMVSAWRVDSEPALDGTDPMWQSILPVWVATTPQQMTPPMGGGEIPAIGVRAVHWDERLYVMVEWADTTPDWGSARPEEFSDAVAIQFPAVAASTVPAICMGQADRAVNIWQWRADNQQGVPDLPEGGYVDLYPFTDELHYTARAAGNPVATAAGAVQNLVAGGFGTLSPADSQTVIGNAVHGNGRWSVVMSREFAAPGESQPVFSGQGPVDVALAVWDGSRGQRNGIKSVTSFIRLQISDVEATPPGAFRGVVVGLAAITVLGMIWSLWLGLRRWTRPDADES